MIYPIKITESAEKDLLEIAEYISVELLAPETAFSQLQQIEVAIFSLEKFPERHPIIKINSFRDEEIRMLLVNNYIVFYQFKHSIVYVLRVLYARRNWKAIL